MLARLGLLLCLGLLAVNTARAADVGTVPGLEPPQVVFTRQAGVILRQEASVHLGEGENRFLFDYGRYDIDPATLELRVLKPAEGVRWSAGSSPRGSPGRCSSY